MSSTNDPTAPAEFVAIRAACAKLKSFQLTDCELYTSCEPCLMGLAAIYWARIPTIYFGNTRPLLREVALGSFRTWAETTDKVRY